MSSVSHIHRSEGSISVLEGILTGEVFSWEQRVIIAGGQEGSVPGLCFRWAEREKQKASTAPWVDGVEGPR